MRDLLGRERSLAGLRGKPALIVFFASSAPASEDALRAVEKGYAALVDAGVQPLAIALDGGGTSSVKDLVAIGSPEIGASYTILNHYLFVGKEDLRLPTAFLLNSEGEIVKVYRDAIVVSEIIADAARIGAAAPERLARALPFSGKFYSVPGERNYLQYGLELVEQGLESKALFAFEHAARGTPSAFTFYSLGTLYMKGGQPAKAGAAFKRALDLQADFAEASNGLGALLAEGGDVPSAIGRFRAALEATPDYPDALNNLGYALIQTGHEDEGRDLCEKALKLQPDFAEAMNNIGIYFARHGEMGEAESYFKQAVGKRAGYGEAANNLALVLMTHDAAAEATSVLRRVLEENPAFEPAYITLARVYRSTGQPREAITVLERLLQRNPKNPAALEMVRALRGAS